MKKLFTILLTIVLAFMLATPAFAVVIETKPAIAGNHYVVESTDNQSASKNNNGWRNPRADHTCEGCEKVHQLKEKEYDNDLFGLWTWKLPSWWYWVWGE